MLSKAVPSVSGSLITKSGWYALLSENEPVLNIGTTLALSGDEPNIVLNTF